nr:MAG TPA: hypothetical protein [Bacteriophage sp.]
MLYVLLTVDGAYTQTRTAKHCCFCIYKYAQFRFCRHRIKSRDQLRSCQMITRKGGVGVLERAPGMGLLSPPNIFPK